MGRMLLHLSVALVAFHIGWAGALAFEQYLEFTPAEAVACSPEKQELIEFAVPLPPEVGQRLLPPGSLPAELQRLDMVYKTRCQLPTDWNGGWPTVEQLARFRACNDEWAGARREAIKAEMENYLTQF